MKTRNNKCSNKAECNNGIPLKKTNQTDPSIKKKKSGTVAPMPITTNVVGSNTAHGEVYSIHHYAIKKISGLRKVGGFHRLLWFPPPIKPTATI